MPQNSSGSSASLARTSRPSAVTSSTAARLSIVRPNWRCSRPDAATQGQPGDAGMADDADRADEAVRLGGDVELAEQRAAVRPGGRRPGSTSTPRIARQVHDQAAVAGRVTGRAVAARLDGDLEVAVPAEADRRRNLADAPRADDDRGPAVVTARSRGDGRRRRPGRPGVMTSPRNVSRRRATCLRVSVVGSVPMTFASIRPRRPRRHGQTALVRQPRRAPAAGAARRAGRRSS